MRMVIVGGVAAGMSAASKLKRSCPEADVVVFEKGQYISYGACGLPYFVAGINDDYRRMLIRSAEDFAKQGIDVRLQHEVLRVSPKDKMLMVRNHADGVLTAEPYDKLLIATGAEAFVPPVSGVDSAGVHTLKNIPDGLALQEDLEGKNNIVVVGGGYIGVEVAESLLETGRQVRLIEAAPHILAPFDPEIREILQNRMVEKGMSIHLNESLEAIVPDAFGRVQAVRTTKGEYSAELVVLALGVRPSTRFLASTDIRLARNGAIMVDRGMRTNLPDIFAAGDCAMTYDRILEQETYSALGTVANKCGRIAGESMLDKPSRFEGCLGSAAIAVCGLEAARTGLGEAVARQYFGEITVAFVQANDRPPYYPNPTPLWIKLICEQRTRRVLGGQIVGEKGAVLRVDALAAAITSGMTAPELGMADFCYAPPFSSVWDALNIAGNAVK